MIALTPPRERYLYPLAMLALGIGKAVVSPITGPKYYVVHCGSIGLYLLFLVLIHRKNRIGMGLFAVMMLLSGAASLYGAILIGQYQPDDTFFLSILLGWGTFCVFGGVRLGQMTLAEHRAKRSEKAAK